MPQPDNAHESGSRTWVTEDEDPKKNFADFYAMVYAKFLGFKMLTGYTFGFAFFLLCF